MAAELTEKNAPLRVAIIGAGPGGLVLAQLLRHDERFQVTVYERGSIQGNGISLVGFRILLASTVLDTLRLRLLPDVRDLVDRAVGTPHRQGNRVAFTDETLHLKCRLDVEISRTLNSVSRWKLRNALLSDHKDFLQFGRTYTSYEENEEGVKVKFADGETVHCDVLVGADGAGSRIRKQLLPTSTRSDSGVTVLYFKAPFTPETEAMLPWVSGSMVKSRCCPLQKHTKGKGVTSLLFPHRQLFRDDLWLSPTIKMSRNHMDPIIWRPSTLTIPS